MKIVIFNIHKNFKQSKPGRTVAPIEFSKYGSEPLCVLRTLLEYLERTKDVRIGQNKLLISYLKPHKAVTSSTIGRWVKLVMSQAGINTNVFKAHSTRAALTSAAYKSDVNISDIMKTAGWKNAATFAKFYKKPIIENEFVNALIS